MQIKEIGDSKINNYKVSYTNKDLENEYDAYILLKLVKSMFESGLISREEQNKIIQKIIDQFTPYLSKIVVQMT